MCLICFRNVLNIYWTFQRSNICTVEIDSKIKQSSRCVHSIAQSLGLNTKSNTTLAIFFKFICTSYGKSEIQIALDRSCFFYKPATDCKKSGRLAQRNFGEEPIFHCPTSVSFYGPIMVCCGKWGVCKK